MLQVNVDIRRGFNSLASQRDSIRALSTDEGYSGAIGVNADDRAPVCTSYRLLMVSISTRK
jgi:hypothetical protein